MFDFAQIHVDSAALQTFAHTIAGATLSSFYIATNKVDDFGSLKLCALLCWLGKGTFKGQPVLIKDGKWGLGTNSINQ